MLCSDVYEKRFPTTPVLTQNSSGTGRRSWALDTKPEADPGAGLDPLLTDLENRISRWKFFFTFVCRSNVFQG